MGEGGDAIRTHDTAEEQRIWDQANGRILGISLSCSSLPCGSCGTALGFYPLRYGHEGDLSVRRGNGRGSMSCYECKF